nr:hypothetical protein [Nostoc linckia]
MTGHFTDSLKSELMETQAYQNLKLRLLYDDFTDSLKSELMETILLRIDRM